MKDKKEKIILGVTESDSHVVGNQLIAHHLRANGYDVINLGPCTPVSEFAEACMTEGDVKAIVVGSLNGHALNDLKELKSYKDARLISCPIILGGNLTVGSDKNKNDLDLFFKAGVDVVLNSFEELLPALQYLSQHEGIAV